MPNLYIDFKNFPCYFSWVVFVFNMFAISQKSSSVGALCHKTIDILRLLIILVWLQHQHLAVQLAAFISIYEIFLAFHMNVSVTVAVNMCCIHIILYSIHTIRCCIHDDDLKISPEALGCCLFFCFFCSIYILFLLLICFFRLELHVTGGCYNKCCLYVFFLQQFVVECFVILLKERLFLNKYYTKT